MNRRGFGLMLAGAAVSPWIPAWSRPARAASRPDAFRYAGGPAELVALDQAIEAAIASFPGPIRPIARRRLESGHRPSGTLTLRADERSVVVQMHGKATLDAPLDGSPVAWRSTTGERLQVRARGTADGYMFSFVNARGRSWMRFDLRGAVLEIRSRIEDERLAVPLGYRFTYRRS